LYLVEHNIVLSVQSTISLMIKFLRRNADLG
jgi:hypothetical protein